LEGAIPDAIAKRVIAEIITPKFKTGDFAGGIDAGVNQIIGLIEGEKLPEAKQEISHDLGAIWFIGFFIVIFLIKLLNDKSSGGGNGGSWQSSGSSWSSGGSSSSWSGGGGGFSGGGASGSW
jgi:uncharacterized protein